MDDSVYNDLLAELDDTNARIADMELKIEKLIYAVTELCMGRKPDIPDGFNKMMEEPFQPAKTATEVMLKLQQYGTACIDQKQLARHYAKTLGIGKDIFA